MTNVPCRNPKKCRVKSHRPGTICTAPTVQQSRIKSSGIQKLSEVSPLSDTSTENQGSPRFAPSAESRRSNYALAGQMIDEFGIEESSRESSGMNLATGRGLWLIKLSNPETGNELDLQVPGAANDPLDTQEALGWAVSIVKDWESAKLNEAEWLDERTDEFTTRSKRNNMRMGLFKAKGMSERLREFLGDQYDGVIADTL